MVSKKHTSKGNYHTFWKIIERILIPLVLLAICGVLALYHINRDPGITVLLYPHSTQETKAWKNNELHAGDKATGSFTARDDNLGIVAVRFHTFSRINNDSVIFRIKELGKSSWYYEADYLVDQFQPDQTFTFGFPIIENSEGKKYTFEIESVRGIKGDAVGVSPIEPVYVTKYQYQRAKVLSDRNYALQFFQKKLINTYSDINFVLAFIVYILPLLMYIFWYHFFEKYFHDKYYYTLLPLVLMLLTVCFGFVRNDVLVIGVMSLWLYFLLLFRLSSNISFSFFFIWLIPMVVTYYLGFDVLARGFGVLVFMSLVVGIIVRIVELYFPEYKKKDTKEYFSYFTNFGSTRKK